MRKKKRNRMPASASGTCEACWKAPFESVFCFGLQWDKKSLHPTLLYAYLLLEGECTCVQITVFRPWSCLEGYISIWGLYQVHPTACRTFLLWWGSKMFPVWERGLKLHLIWVHPSGLSCGCFCVAKATLDMPFQWDHAKSNCY